MKLDELERKLYKLDGGSDLEDDFKTTEKVVEPKIIQEEIKTSNSLEKEKIEEKIEDKEEKIEVQKNNLNLNTQPIQKTKSGFLFKFIVGFCLLIIFGGLGYFYLFLKLKPIENINLELLMPEKIFVSTPLNFEISILNPSEDVLKDAKLTIILPKGVLSLDKKEQIKFDLGELKQNLVIKRNFNILVLNEDIKTTKKIKAILDYSLGGRQRFQYFKEFSFFPELEPIEISFKKPEFVFSREEFEYLITVDNLTNAEYQEINLELVTPRDFELLNYEGIEKIKQKNFVLKNLRPFEKRNIKILGKINRDATTTLSFNFGVILTNKIEDEDSILAKKGFSLNLARDEISLNVLVNNSSNYLASDNEILNYRIEIKNNSPKEVSDIILKVKFLTDIFDFSSLKGNFNFDEKEKALIWMPSNNLSLRSLPADGNTSFVFTVKLKKLISESGNLKNLKALIEVTLDSPTIINPKTDKTFVKKIFETKIKGNLKAEQLVFYRFLEGDEGEGFIPLKVNEPTILKLVWRVNTDLTDFNNVKLRAYLRDNVELKEIISYPEKYKPVYNSRTKEIVWQINKVLANSKNEAVFKIEVLPKERFLNQYMPIISELSYEAIDDFTKNKISSSFKALDSASIEDLKNNQNLLKVVE